MDVTVVIPTYNRAHCLARALASVAAQTFPAREVVVVDDGSRDGTDVLVQRGHPGVRYLYQRHAGVSAARNRGIRAATSNWIAFLDSDDAWIDDKLARQAAATAVARGYRLVHCDETWVRHGRPLAQKRHHRKRGGWVFEHSLPRCAISPSAAVLHRSLFDDYGMFDETLPACEDYDLWLRITAREPVLFVPDALLVKHGGHPDQLSRRISALDRYRIRSLLRLIESGALSPGQRAAARAVLERKLDIFITGAQRRGHYDDVARHESFRRRVWAA